MSRLFLVFSYRTLKWVPGIVTRISSSKTSRIIFDLLNSFMPIRAHWYGSDENDLFVGPCGPATFRGAVCRAPNQRTLATLPV